MSLGNRRRVINTGCCSRCFFHALCEKREKISPTEGTLPQTQRRPPPNRLPFAQDLIGLGVLFQPPTASRRPRFRGGCHRFERYSHRRSVVPYQIFLSTAKPGIHPL